MMNALWQHLQLWYSEYDGLIRWLGPLSLLMFLGSLIVVPIIIVALPSDFLVQREKATGHLLLHFWYVPYLIVKNILGLTFILAGLAMLVLPGQGLLTIFLGLALVSFPRKRVLIRRIVGQQRIIKGINKLRHRFNKASLMLPGE